MSTDLRFGSWRRNVSPHCAPLRGRIQIDMRLPRILLFASFVSVIAFAQNPNPIPVAPMPADPLEPVTGGIVVPSAPDQRLAAQQIIVKARDLYKLHAGS